jgi:hypothetical protein
MDRTTLLAIAIALCLAVFGREAAAQPLGNHRPMRFARPQLAAATVAAPQPVEAAAEVAGSPIAFDESLQQYLTRLVLEEMPREYENTKKWQGSKRVMSGLDVELEGLKLETRRQWKEVNHGTWSRYRLQLIEPENEFDLRLENLRDLGDNRAAFDLVGVARLDCHGRLARWQRGVQLMNVYADADAKVRLTAHVEVKMGLDPRTLPPDILLDPVVTSADLRLEEFKLQRISKADGPVVKQLGEVVEEGIQEYLAENRQKLVDAMNAQIGRKRERLRIPVSKLASSPWGEWFSGFLKQ